MQHIQGAMTKIDRYPGCDLVSSNTSDEYLCEVKYPEAFFLCQQAGIPCILVSSGIHQWNMVYAEGRWWEADLSACDVDGVTFQTNGAVESEIVFDGTDEFREQFYVTADRVLWDKATKEYLDSDYTDARPEITKFAKEVLLPGSTK